MSGAAAKPIRRVGVVGAGVMGSGIAQWLAARGCDVVLRDTRPEALTQARETMRTLFEGAVRRGKLTAPEASAGARRIATTSEWAGLAERDLVIEAVIEDVALKRTVWREIAAVVSPDALIASNTSALPLEEFALGVPRPERVLGLHFFNPVSRMPLVELVCATTTSAATREAAADFLTAIGKEAVVCRSSPGFVVTRVLFFYLNAAVELWERGVPGPEIDAALQEFGWPMGPMRLIDEVGLDVTAFIFSELAHFFPTRFEPSGACARLVSAGLRGRKGGAGRGFYRPDAAGGTPNETEARSHVVAPLSRPSLGRAALQEELMRVMVEEAERCVAEEVVASADEVDRAMRLGAGFPASRGGLLAWARSQRSRDVG